MNNNKSPEEDYLSEEEIRLHLESLNHADIHRLHKIARALEGRGWTADDFYNEALARVWDRRRAKWKKGMGVVPHLKSIMESIADSVYKEKCPENFVKYSKDAPDAPEPNYPSGDEPLNAEEARIEKENKRDREQKAKETVKDVFELFQDDEHATFVLNGLKSECSVSEICTRYGLTSTQYESARAQIRRKLKINYPKGWR